MVLFLGVPLKGFRLAPILWLPNALSGRAIASSPLGAELPALSLTQNHAIDYELPLPNKTASKNL
jgi:hypothetical protein